VRVGQRFADRADFRDRHIPLVTGNSPHIMHDKFMVVDGRFVFGGTANWTDSDLRLNSNNFFLIDSGPIAADFTAEFEQMFGGRFGAMKTAIDNGRVYEIGDTTVELWFSPNEDAMGRMLELEPGPAVGPGSGASRVARPGLPRALCGAGLR
jgi:phosphatidylserine/phosphatidylglycerophosphate/cardiolipin synthase-like enzyme